MEKVELLMPAGNMEKLKYAINFGADAVYAGVPVYSLRARENKFEKWNFLEDAVKYCHDRGKKIYFTANIFPHNVKLSLFLDAMEKMVAMKPDAFIMADPGLIHMTREHFPEVEIHLSVQANNVNWASAKFWHEQVGIKRIILSRELKLEEVREIQKHNPTLDIEFFIHGAICMAYSGRCLLSNYMTYRDANQGTCAHSCRWKYNVHEGKIGADGEVQEYVPIEGRFFLEEEQRPGQMMEIDEDVNGTYIMNAKDLCMLEYLEELIGAGVMSLKAEGRSKSIYYAAITARAYRIALDALEKGELTKELINELLDEVFTTSNRGFMPGFLMGDPQSRAQEYEERNGHSTHKFAGAVRGLEGNNLVFEVRNRLNKGDKIGFCFPDKKDDFEIELNVFKDKKGELREEFSGGAGNIYIELSDSQVEIFEKYREQGEGEIFCVARMELTEEDKMKVRELNAGLVGTKNSGAINSEKDSSCGGGSCASSSDSTSAVEKTSCGDKPKKKCCGGGCT